jgi:hypothetical protein
MILAQALHGAGTLIEASLSAEWKLLDRYRNYAEHIFNYTPMDCWSWMPSSASGLSIL